MACLCLAKKVVMVMACRNGHFFGCAACGRLLAHVVLATPLFLLILFVHDSLCPVARRCRSRSASSGYILTGASVLFPVSRYPVQLFPSLLPRETQSIL